LKAFKIDISIGIYPIGQILYFQEENFLNFVVNVRVIIGKIALKQLFMAYGRALPNHCFAGKKYHSPLSCVLYSLVSTLSKSMYQSLLCCKNTGNMAVARRST